MISKFLEQHDLQNFGTEIVNEMEWDTPSIELNDINMGDQEDTIRNVFRIRLY